MKSQKKQASVWTSVAKDNYNKMIGTIKNNTDYDCSKMKWNNSKDEMFLKADAKGSLLLQTKIEVHAGTDFQVVSDETFMKILEERKPKPPGKGNFQKTKCKICGMTTYFVDDPDGGPGDRKLFEKVKPKSYTRHPITSKPNPVMSDVYVDHNKSGHCIKKR